MAPVDTLGGVHEFEEGGVGLAAELFVIEGFERIDLRAGGLFVDEGAGLRPTSGRRQCGV